jgi:hypothetical protein
MRIRDPRWRQFGSGIRDGKKSDPGSGSRDKHPGSATLPTTRPDLTHNWLNLPNDSGRSRLCLISSTVLERITHLFKVNLTYLFKMKKMENLKKRRKKYKNSDSTVIAKLGPGFGSALEFNCWIRVCTETNKEAAYIMSGSPV